MPAIVIITAPNASLGFRAAGIETREAGEDDDISALLLSIQNEGRHGLVAIDERILKRAAEASLKRIAKKGLPIIIPISIPSTWGEEGMTESPVLQIIRKAIGYQIKLKR